MMDRKKRIKKVKQQILIIGGGSTFPNNGVYLKALKESEPNLDRMRYVGSWKHSLQEKLGGNYDVLLPHMPKTSDARYTEWSIYFSKIAPLLDDNVILIGHSLGGIFLAGWLSINDFPKKIKAVILIAAPFNDETTESLGDFFLPAYLEGLRQSSDAIFLLYSKDDPVVPFSELEKYQEDVPNANIRIFNDKQHFNQEVFPELVELIKAL